VSPWWRLTPLLAVTLAAGQCSRPPLSSVDAGPSCAYKGQTYEQGARFPSTDGCNSCHCDDDGVARCTVKACSDAGRGDASPFVKNCPDPLTGELGPCPDAGPSPDVGKMCFDVGGQVIECPDGGSSDQADPDGGTVCQDSAGTIIPCGDGGIGTCAYLGKIYRPGDSFGAADGCDICTCTARALVECTATGCADAGADTATTCDHAGKPYSLGATFPADDGCNTCSCVPGGITCTEIACQDAGPSPCGLDAVYSYGDVGGRRGYHDQVTIAPSPTAPRDQATYVRTRTATGGAAGISCSPPFPACGDAAAIDVSDILADLRDPVVQAYLGVPPSTTVPFLGFDSRLVDGTAFAFMRGDGHGFLVGQPCDNGDASSCVPVPPAIDALVNDLRALDDQQLRSPSCAMFR